MCVFTKRSSKKRVEELWGDLFLSERSYVVQRWLVLLAFFVPRVLQIGWR